MPRLVDIRNMKFHKLYKISSLKFWKYTITDVIQMDIANGGGLQLTNFAISHVGHIDIDVSGLGPLDWILELLVDFVDTFLKVS